MKRFVGLLSAALLATTVAVLAPSSPASADICVGTGTATIAAPGLQYPVVGAYRSLGYVFGTTTGACTNGDASLTAAGNVQGYCGHSTGTGADTRGHSIQWTSAGSVLLLTGEIVGVVVAVPNVPAGESCNPPAGALNFIVAGVVTRQNCGAITLTNSLTTVAPNLSVHTSIHACVGTQL